MSPRYRNSSRQSDDEEPDQRQTCSVSGKRMYVSEREADATAAHLMADKEKGPSQLRTYRCLYCMAWHLTSNPPKAKRKK